jgi:hypothetical protein
MVKYYNKRKKEDEDDLRVVVAVFLFSVFIFFICGAQIGKIFTAGLLTD